MHVKWKRVDTPNIRLGYAQHIREMVVGAPWHTPNVQEVRPTYVQSSETLNLGCATIYRTL